jgi:hypothetical protein
MVEVASPVALRSSADLPAQQPGRKGVKPPALYSKAKVIPFALQVDEVWLKMRATVVQQRVSMISMKLQGPWRLVVCLHLGF